MGELIPDEARRLYEKLIDDGSIPVPGLQTHEMDAAHALVAMGLATVTPREPQSLAAVGPSAAFERILKRWHDGVQSHVRRLSKAATATVVYHEAFSRRQGPGEPGAAGYVITDRRQVMAVVRALHSSATSEVATWNTGPYLEGDAVDTAERDPEVAEAAAVYLEPDTSNLEHGGRVREVYDQTIIRDFPSVAVELDKAPRGVQNRVVDQLPMKLMLVDDHTALVPLGPYGRPALLIRSPQIVAVFRLFFELVWETATPWGAVPDGDDAKSGLRGRILSAAAAGMKDDAIARHCGISARTVRRHFAEMEAELGAGNRFAAGVAAVRRGWLER